VAQILVVDGCQPIARAIGAALEYEGLTVDVCHDGVVADGQLSRDRPTVVLLEALLPGLTGHSICRRLRRQPEGESIGVLMVASLSGIEDKVQAFEAGCDDFLPKPFDMRELVSRVHALLRRYRGSEEHIVRVGGLELNAKTAEAVVDGKTKLLTPVEFELLQFLMAHPGEAFSSANLLEAVWGYPSDIGNNDLVRVHIHNLRAKLEPDPHTPSFLKTRPRHGYFIDASAA
jgi:DNA-binding response OmpR family regulator